MAKVSGICSKSNFWYEEMVREVHSIGTLIGKPAWEFTATHNYRYVVDTTKNDHAIVFETNTNFDLWLILQGIRYMGENFVVTQ